MSTVLAPVKTTMHPTALAPTHADWAREVEKIETARAMATDYLIDRASVLIDGFDGLAEEYLQQATRWARTAEAHRQQRDVITRILDHLRGTMQ